MCDPVLKQTNKKNGIQNLNTDDQCKKCALQWANLFLLVHITKE